MGMFDELGFGAAGDDYASVDDLLGADDLPEIDVKIKRWHRNGKPMRLRVRALSLDAQEAIDIAALLKHPKTGEWVRSTAAFNAATLQYLVIVPQLSAAQASLMRAHNPTIIDELCKFGWSLSAIDHDLIEKLANDLAPPEPAALPNEG